MIASLINIGTNKPEELRGLALCLELGPQLVFVSHLLVETKTTYCAREHVNAQKMGSPSLIIGSRIMKVYRLTLKKLSKFPAWKAVE